MLPFHLLAKPVVGEDEQRSSLLEHLRLTYVASAELFRITGEAQLKTLQLDPGVYLERYKRILLLAAATHDVGKANTLFQLAVRESDAWQSLRHEWISFLLLRFTDFGNRIKKAFPEETREDDFNFLVWAVAGHHRKSKSEIIIDEGERNAKLLLESSDFKAYLQWFDSETDLFRHPIFSDFNPEEVSQTYIPEINKTLGELLALPGIIIRREIINLTTGEDGVSEETSPANKRFMAAIRSSLIASDVAASAANDPTGGFKNGSVEEFMRDWFNEGLGRTASTKDIEKIIALKEKELPSKNTLLNSQRRQFQTEVANSKSRVTLCVAGCGSGKTLAAWKWAFNHCPPDGTRVFFCYPTTGTASSGFADYLIDPQNKTKEGELLHSRAIVDQEFLEKLYRAKLKDAKRIKLDDVALEAETIMKSLKIWGQSVVCCTVDVALRFLVNEYAGTLSWPALAQSIFIFDEIHSYDDRLFHWLIEFLKIARGAEVLLLTASLPQERFEKIQKVVEKKSGTEKLNVVYGPNEWEKIKRYQRFTNVQDVESPMQIAVDRFRKGERILWVCNTVDRAIDAAESLFQMGEDVCKRTIAYHSRFKYRDRIRRQKECVDAFQSQEPAICVATQVAEMSLDLSADFLISDLAPIPSLIQRLGRLNRRAVEDSPRPFFIVEPQKENGEFAPAPYLGEEYEDWDRQTREWLDALGDDALSQLDLKQKWTPSSVKSSFNEPAPWLAPGPWGVLGVPLRDASSGIQVLLDVDLSTIKKAGVKKFVELVVPMTRPPFSLDYLEKYGCYVACYGKNVAYDERLGARWTLEGEESASLQNNGAIII